MTANLENEILDYLNRPAYKPVKAARLAQALKVGKQGLWGFQAALERLVETGRVREGKKGLVRLQAAAGTVVGTIKRISSGAGFLIPHEAPPGVRDRDVFISAADIRDAHTGDEVLVRLSKQRRSRGRRCGRVEEILDRATNIFVGTYCEREGQSYVQADGNTFSAPILVGDPGAKGAQPNDKVVIEMLRFPMQHRVGEAVLIEVLGPHGKPGVDTISVIREFGLPDEFPEDVLKAARQEAANFDERLPKDRLDLTKETIVTIDPADARDFDDATSLSRSKDGHWHLGVHIADVSHFVQPGSTLDREAQKRGTSVYLPTRVLPMLPEVISNGLASLQKGKVRYTKSVLIEFTADGVPLATEFANSAIKVTRRLAYEEVLPIIWEPEKHKTRVAAKVRALLSRMHELAMILRARRFGAGALELHLPEVKLDFDKQGRVTGAREITHDESHQIIEEFMLAANIAVAGELADRGISFLRRVHADPDELKLRTLAEFVTALGYPLKRYQSRQDLQALLIRVRETPHQHAVNYALLRSLKQAEYAGVEMGHYALAVENYCHFTSPIRRYPDLLVHRLIDRLLRTKRHVKGPNELELQKTGKQCSATERRAAEAERELTKLKLLAFMVERVGDELEAIITGVEQFGIFCQGVEIPVEGLVHISAIEGPDYFDYEAETFSLVGRRTGTRYRLGDRVRVQVAHVDLNRRKLDFRLVTRTSQPTAGKTRKTTAKRAAKRPTNQPTAKSGAKSKSRSGSSRGSTVRQPRKKSARKKRL